MLLRRMSPRRERVRGLKDELQESIDVAATKQHALNRNVRGYSRNIKLNRVGGSRSTDSSKMSGSRQLRKWTGLSSRSSAEHTENYGVTEFELRVSTGKVGNMEDLLEVWLEP